MALEQPNSGDAKGLKSSLDNAVKNTNFSIDRKSQETGLESDRKNTTKLYIALKKQRLVIIYYLPLCLSHKLELALHDAFKLSSINEAAEEQLVSAYYLFKRANFKCRLFKRHAIIVGKLHRHFKRPGGTCWVAH